MIASPHLGALSLFREENGGLLLATDCGWPISLQVILSGRPNCFKLFSLNSFAKIAPRVSLQRKKTHYFKEKGKPSLRIPGPLALPSTLLIRSPRSWIRIQLHFSGYPLVSYPGFPDSHLAKFNPQKSCCCPSNLGHNLFPPSCRSQNWTRLYTFWLNRT